VFEFWCPFCDKRSAFLSISRGEHRMENAPFEPDALPGHRLVGAADALFRHHRNRKRDIAAPLVGSA